MRNDSQQQRQQQQQDKSIPRTWLGLKEAGRNAYQRGEYKEALHLYRTALLPEYECTVTADRQVILSNVVACRLKIIGGGGEDAQQQQQQQQQATAAVKDAQQCVQLNPHWGKAHVRLASAYIALGRSNDACNSLQTALGLDPGNRMAREMLVQELGRERTGDRHRRSSTDNQAQEDEEEEEEEEEDTVRPPPQNPSHVPSTAENTGNQVEETNDIDGAWTWHERLQFYLGSITTWYTNQSDNVRTMIKAGIVFLAIYVAFGGRFGLENSFLRYKTSLPTRTRGNYGEGNAYDEFYRQRASSNYDNSYQSNSRQSHSQNQRNRYHDYEYGGSYDDNRGGFAYHGYSSTSSWGSNPLPSIAILAGIAYLGHVAGINPLHALVMLNVMGGRRRRFGGGGALYGRGGGFGRGRRRRPGGFYW